MEINKSKRKSQIVKTCFLRFLIAVGDSFSGFFRLSVYHVQVTKKKVLNRAFPARPRVRDNDVTPGLLDFLHDTSQPDKHV